MMMTSIIIPTYNGLPLLEQCIYEIRRFTAMPYEIIVVDNGSIDGTIDYLCKEQISFVSFPSNRGFPSACNAGLRIARGDALLLLNNDIVVSHGWLSNMLQCLYSFDDIGIVGPMSNYVSGKQHHHLGYSSIQRFHEMTEEANCPDPNKWQRVNRLVGMCFLFKRELLKQVGYLDERFSPGHFEDDDYCYRARLAGYRLMLARDTYVHHHGSVSFKKVRKEELAELIVVNHRKFMEKWSVDPLVFI